MADYPARIPRELAADQILVHNHVRPEYGRQRQGTRGFRFWLQSPNEVPVEGCDCRWAPGLAEHYRAPMARQEDQIFLSMREQLRHAERKLQQAVLITDGVIKQHGGRGWSDPDERELLHATILDLRATVEVLEHILRAI